MLIDQFLSYITTDIKPVILKLPQKQEMIISHKSPFVINQIIHYIG